MNLFLFALLLIAAAAYVSPIIGVLSIFGILDSWHLENVKINLPEQVARFLTPISQVFDGSGDDSDFDYVDDFGIAHDPMDLSSLMEGRCAFGIGEVCGVMKGTVAIMLCKCKEPEVCKPRENTPEILSCFMPEEKQ